MDFYSSGNAKNTEFFRVQCKNLEKIIFVETIPFYNYFKNLSWKLPEIQQEFSKVWSNTRSRYPDEQFDQNNFFWKNFYRSLSRIWTKSFGLIAKFFYNPVHTAIEVSRKIVWVYFCRNTKEFSNCFLTVNDPVDNFASFLGRGAKVQATFLDKHFMEKSTLPNQKSKTVFHFFRKFEQTFWVFFAYCFHENSEDCLVCVQRNILQKLIFVGTF